MSGPKRNPDRLNTIGIVVVGICGAVLVYVSIVALQAFYLNDSSEVQTMADYGGQDKTFKSQRTAQLGAIKEIKPNEGKPTFRIPIDHAMQLVLRDVKIDPSNLVPSVGAATKATVEVPPVGPDGRLPRVMAAPPAGAGSGSAAAPVDTGAGGTGSAAPAGAGSAAGSASGSTSGPSPTPNPGTEAKPLTPTGGTGPGGGTAPAAKEKLDTPTPAGATPRPVDPKGATPAAGSGSAAKGGAKKGNGR